MMFAPGCMKIGRAIKLKCGVDIPLCARFAVTDSMNLCLAFNEGNESRQKTYIIIM